MAVEMKKYKLSDLCDVFGRIGFRGYTVNDLVSKGQGAITFSPSDINNFTLSFDNCTYISLYKYEESPEIKVFNGDIIFTKTGSSIGKTAYVENLTEKATINPQFVVLKNFKCNSRYLFYILTSKWFQKNVWNIVVGSTVPTLSQEDFKKRELYLPERNIQDKAASALSAIDKRIENLRAQNRVLEQTAKAIYDYTFLQCAGHQTTYNKILNRNIPENWDVKNMSELAEVVNGATPSTSEESNFDGEIVWITPKDLSDQKNKFVYFGERTITQRGYDSCSTTMVPVNSILMSSRAPIGLVSIAKCELCTNQGFKTFVPKLDDYTEYLYYYLLTNMKKIEQLGSGTTFKEVSRGSLTSFPVVVPDKKTLDKFNESVKPIFQKQFVNTKQIESLTTQRNTLLPLLMTGQIEV